MSRRKDLAARLSDLQGDLAPARGKRYWRSLEELAGDEVFQELMRQEFPEQADVWPSSLSRRNFMTLMGASLALAGLGGCSVQPAPPAQSVPYVRSPEEVLPGRPLFFATAMPLGAGAVGLLVESHEGRPTKIEGNPDHPASRGATTAIHQASVLSLYDPDRSQTVTFHGEVRGWADAARALRAALDKQRPLRGAGLRILTESVVSPSLAEQLADLLREFPAAHWISYEPVNQDEVRRGAKLAFGQAFTPVHDFSQANVVLSLDADFLAEGPAQLRYAADFMERRRVRTSLEDAAAATMNRLYVVETAVSCTGAKADHRLAVRPSEVEALARTLAAKLGILEGSLGASPVNAAGKWIDALAKDLQSQSGRSLVIAGDRQPALVHLLAHALNDKLGNAGKTVTYLAPPASDPAVGEDQAESMGTLVQEMQAGHVECLLILGGNPVYTAPADWDFAAALAKVPLAFHLSLYQDETSQRCDWQLPQAHFLEAWGDARAFDGTASIMQPLIAPLYAGRSALEVVGMLRHPGEVAGLEIVRSHWRRKREAKQETADFEEFWQTSVHDGVIAGTAASSVSVVLQTDWQRHLQPLAKRAVENRLEIAFAPDPAVYDGRFANSGWLQELPRPITKLTWDNAALLSPTTAEQLGLRAGSLAHGGEHGGYQMPLVELRLGERQVIAPVWIVPGHADGAVTVHLGYGRKAAGKVGGDGTQTVGFDAGVLRTSQNPWFAKGLEVAQTGRTYSLACTQAHHTLDTKTEVVQAATLQEYRRDPGRVIKREEVEQNKEPPHNNAPRMPIPLTMYEPEPVPHEPQHKWGMVIDMTACTGCSGCVVACQAENNIPVVGKEQVLAGREMHWLRIDRYVQGSPAEPEAFQFQPLPCMHCENAPCEYVCPVAATVHSADGLNDMVYNRCVGTRFCSNNCPYKVRRFNFFEYADFKTLPTRLQYNPDVTVRSRGVMEKCTYCVQRIRRAEMDAQAENRPIGDGEILTACQAACPTQAIVFGDLKDSQSTLAKGKESPLHYDLLSELNTRPRTTYLAALRNPNPELEPV